MENAVMDAALGHSAVALMRRAHSTEELPQCILEAAVAVGFARATFSRVEGRRWIPSAHYSRTDDDRRAQRMLNAGRENPPQLDQRLVEGRMFHDGRPRLVSDATADPGVHRELQQAIETHSYVTAPIIADGEIIALVHADLGLSGAPCREADRDMLALVAEAAGMALEHVTARSELRRLHAQVQQLGHTMLAIADEGGRAPEAQLSLLTTREIEVLSLAALGLRNADIGQRLAIAKATVKTHMTRILRKLEAANRAQAVDIYARATAGR